MMIKMKDLEEELKQCTNVKTKTKMCINQNSKIQRKR